MTTFNFKIIQINIIGPDFDDFINLNDLISQPGKYSVESVHWKVYLNFNYIKKK